MRDFSAAIGLVLVIEGVALAGFTEAARRRMAEAAKIDGSRLRLFGVAAAAVGVVIVWAARRVL
ncbi:MAG TPA: DUF2065 family protein [Roseiarcus sp.]|nr:DUF2065 family protein [Roseiarcus sp.]